MYLFVSRKFGCFCRSITSWVSVMLCRLAARSWSLPRFVDVFVGGALEVEPPGG